jgi:hypothetical protein
MVTSDLRDLIRLIERLLAFGIIGSAWAFVQWAATKARSSW